MLPRAHAYRVDRLILAVTGAPLRLTGSTTLPACPPDEIVPSRRSAFLHVAFVVKAGHHITEQQAFWLGFLKEILTSQLSKANLVERNRRNLRLLRALSFQKWGPGRLA